MYRRRDGIHDLPVGWRTGAFQNRDITRIVLLEGGRWVLHRPGVAGHLRLEELKRDVSERSKEVSQEILGKGKRETYSRRQDSKDVWSRDFRDMEVKYRKLLKKG